MSAAEDIHNVEVEVELRAGGGGFNVDLQAGGVGQWHPSVALRVDSPPEGAGKGSGMLRISDFSIPLVGLRVGVPDSARAGHPHCIKISMARADSAGRTKHVIGCRSEHELKALLQALHDEVTRATDQQGGASGGAAAHYTQCYELTSALVNHHTSPPCERILLWIPEADAPCASTVLLMFIYPPTQPTSLVVAAAHHALWRTSPFAHPLKVELQLQLEPEPEPEPEPEANSAPQSEVEAELKPKSEPQPEPEVEFEHESESEPGPEPEPEPEPEPVLEAESVGSADMKQEGEEAEAAEEEEGDGGLQRLHSVRGVEPPLDGSSHPLAAAPSNNNVRHRAQTIPTDVRRSRSRSRSRSPGAPRSHTAAAAAAVRSPFRRALDRTLSLPDSFDLNSGGGKGRGVDNAGAAAVLPDVLLEQLAGGLKDTVVKKARQQIQHLAGVVRDDSQSPDDYFMHRD
jgi:outer membrane biosynthesis protein TonB